MRTMKCPECGEISTFTHYYASTLAYAAPLELVNHDEIRIDYDNAKSGDEQFDEDDEEKCICDKCNKDVAIDEIELVGADEDGEETSPNNGQTNDPKGIRADDASTNQVRCPRG